MRNYAQPDTPIGFKLPDNEQPDHPWTDTEKTTESARHEAPEETPKRDAADVAKPASPGSAETTEIPRVRDDNER